MSKDLKLPAWATVSDIHPKASIVVEVDMAAANEEWLKLLGVTPEAVDQYWLEVAYQCIKLDVQDAISGTQADPRVAGKHALFKFSRADQYQLSNFPAGRGTAAATQGREAREHYRRIRGTLPFSS